MATALISIIAYIAGFFLCYVMLKTEHAAEGQQLTYGGRALAIVLSGLSWLWVLVMLVIAWVQMINANGYWNRPVKPAPIPKPLNLQSREKSDDDELNDEDE